jgi:PKD repeat protein
MLFKNDFKTAVAPVGVAWKKVRQDFPGINLYDPDQSHPSVAGSYLAACVFYSNIFKKTSVGSTHLAGLTNSVVNSLQSYGSNTVLDSLDVWGVGSNKPKVDFTFTPTGSNTYQFTNQTLYANSYNWSFGSTLQNPIYTFTNTGTFSVTLAATNSCTTISKTKQVVIAGVNEQSNKLNFKSFYANDYLYLYNLPKSDALNLKLISVDGKESFNYTINSSKDDYAVYLGNIPKGIYLIRLSANQYYGVNKLIIN